MPSSQQKQEQHKCEFVAVVNEMVDERLDHFIRGLHELERRQKILEDAAEGMVDFLDRLRIEVEQKQQQVIRRAESFQSIIEKRVDAFGPVVEKQQKLTRRVDHFESITGAAGEHLVRMDKLSQEINDAKDSLDELLKAFSTETEADPKPGVSRSDTLANLFENMGGKLTCLEEGHASLVYAIDVLNDQMPGPPGPQGPEGQQWPRGPQGIQGLQRPKGPAGQTNCHLDEGETPPPPTRQPDVRHSQSRPGNKLTVHSSQSSR
eukprot:TRINITY_DN15602_c0_g2_i4.p1 TRINITY_DN15602_c0_g2~~TRINITY_DN15602_c0_g2_i4.p1  ORF type:complete len:263 (-),score=59.98 TRINITY_DN15602_c0_g2_i4:356-1144(-)